MVFRRRAVECPECGHANPKAAHRCLACGAVIWANDQPTVPGVQFALDEPVPPADEAPLEIDLHLPEWPELPTDEAPAQAAPPPTVEEELLADAPEDPPQPAPRPATASAARPAAQDELVSTDERPLNRESRRALTRRAVSRHVGRAAPRGPGGAPPDAFVLDPNEVVRTQLTVWLERFGFRVHTESSAERALGLIGTRHFAVGFLGTPLEGAAAAYTYALVQAARNGHSQDRCALVFVDSAGRPSDRVRASFAGFDSVIGQPIGRGAVARTIDEIGLRLPRDERRA